MKTILALFFVIGMVSCVPVPSSEENFITGILSGVSTLVTTILEGTIGKKGIVNNVGKGVDDLLHHITGPGGLIDNIGKDVKNILSNPDKSGILDNVNTGLGGIFRGGKNDDLE